MHWEEEESYLDTMAKKLPDLSLLICNKEKHVLTEVFKLGTSEPYFLERYPKDPRRKNQMMHTPYLSIFVHSSTTHLQREELNFYILHLYILHFCSRLSFKKILQILAKNVKIKLDSHMTLNFRVQNLIKFNGLKVNLNSKTCLERKLQLHIPLGARWYQQI